MMNNRVSCIAAGVLALVASSVAAEEPSGPATTPRDPATISGMDHGQMDHGSRSGTEQGSRSPTKTNDTSPANGGMDHGSMQGGAPPPDARDPHAYSEGYDFGPIAPPHMMAEMHNFGLFLADRFEAVHTDDDSFAVFDVLAWYGRDYNRLWFKTDGEVNGGELEDAHTELLWGHAVAAYWDTQLGVRYDSGEGPNRTWLAFGIQGLAPYWFDLEATGYFGEEGRSAARLEAEYELLLTQRLILQPRIEASFYGSRDAERELGAGLSSVEAGLRLRYEIWREFAPYVGIERATKHGETAEFARDAGEDDTETRLVAGVRFWF
jgi:copper resistance protein B